jgi:plasmid maintenance system antidote protein VapI
MKPPITPQMSIRFGAFFGQSEDFWHGIQVDCEFRALGGKAKELTRGIQPASALME